MRVAVIVVFASMLTTPSEASKSCMSKTEARQQFGSYIYWHGPEGSPSRAPSRTRTNAARNCPDAIARSAQIGERDGHR